MKQSFILIRTKTKYHFSQATKMYIDQCKTNYWIKISVINMGMYIEALLSLVSYVEYYCDYFYSKKV